MTKIKDVTRTEMTTLIDEITEISAAARQMWEHIVAQEILRQLGGNRFLAMTGAKEIFYGLDYLKMTLPGTRGFVKDGIRVVKVTLTPDDLYRIEFFKNLNGDRMGNLVAKVDGLFVDQLRSTFTEYTGLETTL